jgi:hypothetical protein
VGVYRLELADLMTSTGMALKEPAEMLAVNLVEILRSIRP